MKEIDYNTFLKKYTSAEDEKNPTKEEGKLGDDVTEFGKCFLENKKPPKFIKPEHLRNLLGNHPDLFNSFLQYPSFRKRLRAGPSGEKDIATLVTKAEEEIARNNDKKGNWLKLQKAINIYIYGLDTSNELEIYILKKPIDVSKLNTLCVKLIGYLTEVDPLPDYIKQESLQKIILQAPVTTSVFFKYLNFVKRLKGVSSTDTNIQESSKKLWDNFFLNFTRKIKEAVSGSNAPATQEQLTEPQRKNILDVINQSLILLDAQEEEQKYEQICEEFAAAIDANLASIKKHLETYPGLLSNLIKKRLPNCLNANRLKKLLGFMPEEISKYMDDYRFMSRLLADEIKKVNVLLAVGSLDKLKKDKPKLADFRDIEKIESLFTQWEIRLKLNRAVSSLVNEVIEVASQPVTQPLQENLKEEETEEKSEIKIPSINLEKFQGETGKDKSEAKIIPYNLHNAEDLNEVIDKLNEVLIETNNPSKHLWIETLTEVMGKISKQLADNPSIKEISLYLTTQKDLLKEVEKRALSLQKESMASVIAKTDEDLSSSSTYSP